MMIKKFLIVPILLLILLSIGMVSATDNVTDYGDIISQDIEETPIVEDIDSNVDESINESSQSIAGDSPKQITTEIKTNKVTTYYKENSQLVSYLKDTNNQPVPNRKVSIFINSLVYDKITDNEGKVILKLNLNPGTYNALIKFDGDDEYASSSANAIVKVNKAALTLTTKNYKTYFESGFYFKAKVTNKITKNPVKGVKVLFKVYKNNKYRIYYATTDGNGIAKLKRNLNVGSYKVVTSIKNKNVKSKKSRATLTIKETAEYGCCSLYIQVSKTESVAGFRRDATNAKTLFIVKYKLHGKPAVKQYKTNSYFFHSITTADGWMMGTGGIDNPDINSAIEDIGGKIAKAGKIKRSYLLKIQGYERALGLGHFSIKSPDGNYAVVWAGGIYTGKLKPGEYLSAPNGMSYFRQGTWEQFSKDPETAAIKVGATDPYGINRRDITIFHWKATTKEGKTTSTLKVRAANDNGQLLGRGTGYLSDDIKYRGQFISKNTLPNAPSSKFIGECKFGSIDKLIKVQTTVKAPKFVKYFNESKSFNITVKNKKTKNPVKKLILKLKIGKTVYTVKTNSKGIAKFYPKLNKGSYNVVIYSGNDKYYVSAKSTIKIR